MLEIDSLAQVVTKLDGQEGVVVRFADGHMVKIKSEIYVNIHKAKDNLLFERHVVLMIVNETIDDVMAFLPDIDKANVANYQNKLSDWINSTVESLHTTCYKAIVTDRFDRKRFAIEVSKDIKPFDSLFFKNYEQCQALDEANFRQFAHRVVKEALVKACINNTWLNEFKRLTNINFTWDPHA